MFLNAKENCFFGLVDRVRVECDLSRLGCLVTLNWVIVGVPILLPLPLLFAYRSVSLDVCVMNIYQNSKTYSKDLNP